MSTIFFHITAALYLVSTILYAVYLVTHRDSVVVWARSALFTGFAFHTVTVVMRAVASGAVPATTFHDSLNMFAWLTVAIYVVFFIKYRITVLGAFVAPFVLLLVAAASVLPSEVMHMAPVLESYWPWIHIPLALLGNGFFALAFLLGIMHVIQDHYLKSRKVGGLYFLLPSLEVLDELNYKCLSFGWPLLTLAIITGMAWSEDVLGSYWVWEPRQIWSLITWFLYAALLHGRLTSGWRGRKAAWLSAGAFGILIGSFLVINLTVGGGHGILSQ